MGRRQRYRTPLPTPVASPEEVANGRVIEMGAIMSLLFAVLVGRLWLLQVVRGDEYRERALLNRSRKVQTAAPRGIIVDRRGKTLVTNTTQFAIYLHPEEVFRLSLLLRVVEPPRKETLPIVMTGTAKPKKPRLLTAKERAQLTRVEEYLDRVAALIEVTREELYETIKKKHGGDNDPIPVREKITRPLMARLYERQDDLPGLSIDVVPVRSYPQRKHATHFLGYTASVSAEELKDPKVLAYPREKKYRGGDWIGRAGLEKQYDLYLRGIQGLERFEVDGKGRRRKEVSQDPAKPGATLVLALDNRVQSMAEQVLAGKAGAVVALDPRDGSILAMASTPTYDLTLRTRSMTVPEYASIQEEGGEINRAISAFPPGSTFKIVTAVAGLAEGKITAYTTFSCAGGKYIGKTWKRCHASHGGVALTAALALSCDAYFYSVGERLGPKKLAEWGHKFGLGEQPTLDMPVYSNSKGIMPDPEYKQKKAAGWNRRYKRKMEPEWMGGDTANVSIGQGDVNLSPLQVAGIAAAIANGGTLWSPHLVKKAVGADRPKDVLYEAKPTATSQLGLPRELLDEVARGMRACVEWGTGKGARVSGGIEVFGKSGSAEKRGGRNGGSGANYGWFTCYARQKGQPSTIALCVFLEPTRGENYHGGAAAAPLAKQIIEAHFATGASKPTASPSPAPR